MARTPHTATAATDLQDPAIDPEFEDLRQASMRAFEVRLTHGKIVHVFAHYHDSQNRAGHLHFITVDSNGRQVINQSFNNWEWRELREITTAERYAEFAAVQRQFEQKQQIVEAKTVTIRRVQ